jgi:hypothetical protein
VIRTVRPTDIFALLSFGRRTVCDDAFTLRDLARAHRRVPSASVLADWLPLDDERETLVSIDRGR